MYKIILGVLLFTLILSCAKSKVIKINEIEKEIEPYGWMTTDLKDDKIKYKISTGNIIWSIILFETIIFPVFITGLDLYEPIGLKDEYIIK